MNLIVPSLISDQDLPSGSYKKENPISFENHTYQLVQGNSYVKFKERLSAGVLAISLTIITLGFAIFSKVIVNYYKDFFWGKRKVVYLTSSSSIPIHLKNATENIKKAFTLTVLGYGCYFNHQEQHSNDTFKQALLYFDQALKTDPKCTSALISRAKIHQHRKDLDLALNDLNAVIAINSKDLSALTMRDSILQEKAKPQLPSTNSEVFTPTKVEVTPTSPVSKESTESIDNVNLKLIEPASPNSPIVTVPLSSPTWDEFVGTTKGQGWFLSAKDFLTFSGKNNAAITPKAENTISSENLSKNLPPDIDKRPSVNSDTNNTVSKFDLLRNTQTLRIQTLKKRGYDHLRNRNVSAALTVFENIIKLDSNDLDARWHRAMIRGKQGKLNEALEDFNLILHINPKDSKTLLYRARTHQMKKSFDLALEDLNRAFDLDPKSTKILLVRAIVNQEKNDLQSAVEDCNKAHVLDSKSIEVLLQRAELYIQRNDPDRALTDLNRALILKPKSIESLFLRAKVYKEKDNLDFALKDLNTLFSLNSESSRAFLLRAEIYQVKGNLDLALKDVDAAAALRPKDDDLQKKCNTLRSNLK